MNIRNEVIVGSGTQTPLDKDNSKMYEIHDARTKYPEHILEKKKVLDFILKLLDWTKNLRLYLLISGLD